MQRINTEFSEKIKKYGAFDINACYNCGNCTAICPLSTEDNSFPRKMIRSTILGLEDKIDSSMDPWLCYYCGECSDTCPRDADPGGLMMALRRYQIRKFSLGKIADIFYNGFSSVFPEGYLIGKVDTFYVPPGSGYYKIRVNLAEDMTSLKRVYVANNLLKEEQLKLEATDE